MNFPFGPLPARGSRPGARKAKPGGWLSGLLSGLRLPKLPRISPGLSWGGLKQALRAHPRRAGAFAGLGLVLFLLVWFGSFPVALAPLSPRLALLLAPGNPVAMMQVAHQDRRELNRLLNPPPADTRSSTARARPAATGGETPAGETAAVEAPSPDVTTAEVQRLRDDIRDMARRIVVKSPLMADVYRLLGETAETPDAARLDMQNAYALSRREAVAAFWLLNDAFQRRDYVDGLAKIDTLLRTTPALNTYTYAYLAPMVSDPDARAALVEALKVYPPWRPAFFQSLGDKVNSDDGVLLFLALKEAGAPATYAEMTPYLQARLYAAKDPQGSYNVWLQLLSDEELARLLPVNNPNFASDPSGSPFDWRIGRSSNVSVRLVRIKDDPQARAIRAEFGIGRVRFGGVSQVVFMRPGSYRFEGEQTGTMSAKRGMLWEVRCFPKNDLLGQSGQLFGSRRGWQGFEFDFKVPELGCQTQIIRLLHDARSASEEYASGDIMFSKIEVVPAGAAEPDGASQGRRAN